jgi:predicted dehydrogenase
VEKVMSKVQTINIALIGYGFVGKTFHAPLIQSVDGLRLAVVSSRDEEKVKRDLPDVLVVATPEEAIQHPDIDVVVIASPNATHAPLATLALNAGKHVVVDKPFTLDMKEARDLIALADEKQLLLSVFHNRRWDSDFLGIKQIIAQGTLGKVKHLESHIDRFRPEVRVRWREQNVPGSGLWFDLGPHLIDQTLQLFGLPESVQGNIATLREGAEIDDWAHVVLNYPAHKVILHASMLVAGGTARFTVHGDKGSVVKARIDQQEAQLLAGVIPAAKPGEKTATAWCSSGQTVQRRRLSRRKATSASITSTCVMRCAGNPQSRSPCRGVSGHGCAGSGGEIIRDRDNADAGVNG